MRGFGAIVAAAGSGERLGAEAPKALVEVGGVTLVARATSRLLEAGADPVVVAGPPDHVKVIRGLVADLAGGVKVVAGGASRAGSVRAGLAALADTVDVVAVHDAARAFAPVDLVRRVVAAIEGEVVAAAPAMAVTDTIKRVDGDMVVGTLDREELVAVQTPQAFRREVLRAAHADSPEATDDLALVERLLEPGEVPGRVVVVPGDPAALKLTRPHDLAVLTALLHHVEG